MTPSVNQEGNTNDTPSSRGDNLHLLSHVPGGTQTQCSCGKQFTFTALAQQHASLMNGVALERERRRLEQVNDLEPSDE